MDIHRCRFVPYPASAINALAFSHTTRNVRAPAPASLRLAVGRANGDIEIWNPRNGLWVQETILRGGKDRSIEGLVWTQDLEDEDEDGVSKVAGKLRLFSIGYSTLVTEWDLATGAPVQHSSGNYGEIWCIAAQPRWQAHKDSKLALKEGPKLEQMLAIGCGDGALVLLSTADGGLKYHRTLPHPSGKKARVLSIAFQNRHKLIAGFSDSTIRILDVQGRAQTITMSLGAGPKQGPQEVLVWSVKCLSDGTIVSGDSTGEVKFWDPTTHALVQRIQSHHADVLDLTPSADGSSLLSGGIDRRTVQYQRQPDGKRKGRWFETRHTRLHQNDVKAMATYEASNLKLTASGGLDATPIIIPQGKLGQEHSRALPTLPNQPPLDSAPAKRLLLGWWDREVSIWRVGSLEEQKEAVSLAITSSQPRQLVAKIAVQGEENITSASISSNGGLVAIATSSNIKVFATKTRTASEFLKIQKVEVPNSMEMKGAKIVKFSPDSKWLLVIRNDSQVQAFRVLDDESIKSGFRFLSTSVDLRRNVSNQPTKIKAMDGTHGDYTKSIIRVAWSSDSRIIVGCDLSGFFDSWVLEGHEDLTQEEVPNDVGDKISADDSEDEDEEVKPKVILGQHWTRVQHELPRLPAAPLVLSFRPQTTYSHDNQANGNIGIHPTRHNPHPHSHDLPDGEDRLMVVTIQHQVLEYSVMAGQLSNWSRRNPPTSFPLEFKDTRERVMGCIWDTSASKQRLWLYGSSWLWMFDLARDLGSQTNRPEQIADTNALVLSSKKRKRQEMDADRRELMKNTSGAGSKVPERLRDGGIGSGMLTIDDEAKHWTSFEAERRRSGEDMESADAESSSDESTSSTLMQMRRLSAKEEEAPKTNGTFVSTDEDNPADQVDKDPTIAPPYWRTYKYRPILGILPIGEGSLTNLDTNDEAVNDSGASMNVEVALVERPTWDLDLAPRWED